MRLPCRTWGSVLSVSIFTRSTAAQCFALGEPIERDHCHGLALHVTCRCHELEREARAARNFARHMIEIGDSLGRADGAADAGDIHESVHPDVRASRAWIAGIGSKARHVPPGSRARPATHRSRRGPPRRSSRSPGSPAGRRVGRSPARIHASRARKPDSKPSRRRATRIAGMPVGKSGRNRTDARKVLDDDSVCTPMRFSPARSDEVASQLKG